MKKVILGLVLMLMLALAPAPAQAAGTPICSKDVYSVGLLWDGPVARNLITPAHKVAKMRANVGYKLCWSATYKARWVRLMWYKSRYSKYYPYRNDIDFVWNYQAYDIQGNDASRTVTYNTDYRDGVKITDMRKAPRLYFARDKNGTLRVKPSLWIHMKARIPFSPDPTIDADIEFYVPT